MIELRNDDPGCFSHVQCGIFYNFIYKNEIVGYVAVEPIYDVFHLHLEMLDFNHNILREMQKNWQEIKTNMKKHGFIMAIAAKQTNSKEETQKFQKLINHMDFGQLEKVYLAKQVI